MKTLVNPSETGWDQGRHKGCQSLDLEDSIGIGPEVAKGHDHGCTIPVTASGRIAPGSLYTKRQLNHLEKLLKKNKTKHISSPSPCTPSTLKHTTELVRT